MTEEKKEYPYFDAMPWEVYQEKIFSENGTEDVLEDEVQRQRVEALKSWIGTGKKVLDIAAGWGGISDEIRVQGNDVTILDMPDVIVKAKELHPQLKFLGGSVLNIPTDEKFDAIVASEIIEHVLDLDRFFSEISRVLKPNGQLLITTPNMSRTFNIVSILTGSTIGWEYPNNPIIHCRHFTPTSIWQTLEKYGFKIMDFKGTETGIGMNWSNFTPEEEEFMKKIIDKFTINHDPRFRASLMCVLAEKKKIEQ